MIEYRTVPYVLVLHSPVPYGSIIYCTGGETYRIIPVRVIWNGDNVGTVLCRTIRCRTWLYCDVWYGEVQYRYRVMRYSNGGPYLYVMTLTCVMIKVWYSTVTGIQNSFDLKVSSIYFL